MGWFLLGFGLGALLMAWIFADGAYEAERAIEYYKSEYGYSYAELTEAWRNGRDGGPPIPPRPR